MELESLKPGLQVAGLVPNEMATVIQALPAGADAVTVYYKTASTPVAERKTYTVDYELSPAKKSLYDEVTDYARMEKYQPWGSKFLPRLSEDLRQEIPDAKFFSVRNLYYVECFYQLNRESVILPQLGARLPNVGITPQVDAQTLDRASRKRLAALRKHSVQVTRRDAA